jgi:hypothetical protein
MSKRMAILACVGVAMIAGIAFAYAEVRAGRRAAKQVPPQFDTWEAIDRTAIPPAWKLAKDPSMVYKVEPIPVRGNVKPRTEQEDRLLKEAAEVVARRLPVPEERVQFFSWMDKPDSRVKFGGWWAHVLQVTPTPEGWRITLRAGVFANLDGGGPAAVHNWFIEEYLWSNSTLTFLKGDADPVTGAEPWISAG